MRHAGSHHSRRILGLSNQRFFDEPADELYLAEKLTTIKLAPVISGFFIFLTSRQRS